MYVINGEDVNEMYWRGMNILRTEGRLEDSRNGPVRVMSMPVTSVYHSPKQRVLLDLKRAANPFFHLFESLWMLAGRDDVEALNTYITDFGTRFAEDNGRVHGAYGHRWRRAFGFDQLESIVHKLTKNWSDRQAVLQMWDGRCEDGRDAGVPFFGENDLDGDWKDRPCNTHVYFRIRNEPLGAEQTLAVLDMYVSCRSNDIVYGAYGANAVHFSILMEYIAGRLDVTVGKMYQMSWNYHAYTNVTDKIGDVLHLETYAGHKLRTTPMAKDWSAFDSDLQKFMLWQRGLVQRGETATKHDYVNTWFRHTAEPMFIAHFKWKQAMHSEARKIADAIDAPDWRFAVKQWFEIRTNARNR
jgi:thymidylate synthase